MSTINPEDLRLIEKHLVGNLSAEESAIFREKMQSDAGFRAEVEAYEEAMDAIRDAGRQETKAIFIDEERKLKEAFHRHQPSLLRGILPKVASLLFVAILTVTVYILFSKKGIDAEKLYQESLKEAFPNYWVAETLVVRSGGGSVGEDETAERYHKKMLGAQFGAVHKAMKAYNAKKYDEASRLMTGIDVPRDSFYFYRGNAFFQTENHQAAIADFEHFLSVTPESQELVDVSKWFMALSYLKLGNVEKSKALLQEISVSTTVLMRNRAKELLKKMTP